MQAYNTRGKFTSFLCVVGVLINAVYDRDEKAEIGDEGTDMEYLMVSKDIRKWVWILNAIYDTSKQVHNATNNETGGYVRIDDLDNARKKREYGKAADKVKGYI
jgi:hypothetical protein